MENGFGWHKKIHKGFKGWGKKSDLSLITKMNHKQLSLNISYIKKRLELPVLDIGKKISLFKSAIHL